MSKINKNKKTSNREELMNLQNIENHDLISRTEKLARSERKITHLILLHINEIESRRLYADLGYDGMFSFLTKHLTYSESSAYRRLQSARLLKQIPEIAEKLETGSLNLTQLTQVQKCLKIENKNLKSTTTSATHTISSFQTTNIERAKIALQKIEGHNSFQTEQLLAIEFNQPIQTSEKAKPQLDESVRIEFTLNKEQYQQLLQAKSLLSHIHPEGKWSDIISTLAMKFNQNKLGKQQQNSRSASALGSFNQTCSKSQNSNKGAARIKLRPHIKTSLRRQLLTSAKHECQYTNPITKKKCGSTFQLQLDHIHPVALGGAHDINNLRVLCAVHNRMCAVKSGILNNSYR